MVSFKTGCLGLVTLRCTWWVGVAGSELFFCSIWLDSFLVWVGYPKHGCYSVVCGRLELDLHDETLVSCNRRYCTWDDLTALVASSIAGPCSRRKWQSVGILLDCGGAIGLRIVLDCSQTEFLNLILSLERLDILVALLNYIFLGFSGLCWMLSLVCGVVASWLLLCSGWTVLSTGWSRASWGSVYSTLDGAK